MFISRRSFLTVSTSALAMSLAGCGFRLRGNFSVPFQTIFLDMNRNSPFAARLKRMLEGGSDVVVIDEREKADAVLTILDRQRTRTAISYNADGDVREHELKLTIRFRLATPAGSQYLPDTTLSATRDILYNEDDYLSRDREEAFQIKDMENDIVSQIIRRIEKSQKPKPNPEAQLPQTGLVPER